jgi:hypothetical protein
MTINYFGSPASRQEAGTANSHVTHGDDFGPPVYSNYQRSMF